MERTKYKISIIDFLPENGKHSSGKVDKNGSVLYFGDTVKYHEENWIIVYRYGQILLKQIGMWGMLGLGEESFATIEKQNQITGGFDWLIIGYTSDELYEKVKHIEHQLTEEIQFEEQ